MSVLSKWSFIMQTQKQISLLETLAPSLYIWKNHKFPQYYLQPSVSLSQRFEGTYYSSTFPLTIHYLSSFTVRFFRSIVFAIPTKTKEWITFARESGVKHTTFDSSYELKKLKQYWPDAKYVFHYVSPWLNNQDLLTLSKNIHFNKVLKSSSDNFPFTRAQASGAINESRHVRVKREQSKIDWKLILFTIFRLLIRIRVDGECTYKLGEKFGCDYDTEAIDLLEEAAALGLSVSIVNLITYLKVFMNDNTPLGVELM